mgnify:CR=1 FL=1
MVTVESAKRITRVGYLIMVVGGLVGLVAWLVAFSGDLSRPSIFFIWPIGAGGAIGCVGLILERFYRSA